MPAADERCLEMAEVALLMKAVHGESVGQARFRGMGEKAGKQRRLAYHPDITPGALETVTSGDGLWWEMNLSLEPKGRLGSATRRVVVLRSLASEDFEGDVCPPALVMATL